MTEIKIIPKEEVLNNLEDKSIVMITVKHNSGDIIKLIHFDQIYYTTISAIIRGLNEANTVFIKFVEK